jgi:hypothetical protein
VYKIGDKIIFTNAFGQITDHKKYEYKDGIVVYIHKYDRYDVYIIDDSLFLKSVNKKDIEPCLNTSKTQMNEIKGLKELQQFMKDNNLSENDIINVLKWHLNK